MIVSFDNFRYSKFIENSWLRSNSRAIPNNFTPTDRYNQRQKELIKSLLSRGADILVFVDPEDTNHILGWICYEVINRLTVTHFIYVKASCRQNGIATQLCEAANIDLSQPLLCSAITYITKPNMLGSKYKFIYLPEILDGLLGKCEIFQGDNQ